MSAGPDFEYDESMDQGLDEPTWRVTRCGKTFRHGRSKYQSCTRSYAHEGACDATPTRPLSYLERTSIGYKLRRDRKLLRFVFMAASVSRAIARPVYCIAEAEGGPLDLGDAP